MIDAASKAGATIVKFQYYDALKLLGADSPYLQYATSCQFTKQQHEDIRKYCHTVGMEYLVSVF
jgi:sialic acid synthase SpsE